MHNNVTPPSHPCQHSLKYKRHSDTIPAYSLPLKAEYWRNHLNPNAGSVPSIKEHRRNKRRSNRQCVWGDKLKHSSVICQCSSSYWHIATPLKTWCALVNWAMTLLRSLELCSARLHSQLNGCAIWRFQSGTKIQDVWVRKQKACAV